MQNIVFLVGSVMRDVFLIIVYNSIKDANAYLFCLLLFFSCIKLSLPILLYMVVHCYTFKKVDRVSEHSDWTKIM